MILYIYGYSTTDMIKIINVLLLMVFLSLGCDNKAKESLTEDVDVLPGTVDYDSAKVAVTETPAKTIAVPRGIVKYTPIIDRYLYTNRIEPTLILNTQDRHRFSLLGHTISWSWDEEKEAINIIIDGKRITTRDKVTLNPVWGKNIDSLRFANYIEQIKIYEFYDDDKLVDTIIGFVMYYKPCTGIGCGLNYQLLYDMKTGHESYFGRFRTGFELELYRFNNDGKVDYLSKTYNGGEPISVMDTTEFVMYSQFDDGKFKIFRNERGKYYSFKHTYNLYEETDTIPETFKENWIERVVKQ